MNKTSKATKQTVVIAGASGFIGRWFIEQYRHTYHIVALSRSEVIPDPEDPVEWRMVDLYSLSSTQAALEDADFALYLVHSMQPSTRLNQGSFDDTDLLLADNFARSAEKCGLKQIVFVGGILPKDESQFSKHLRSRYETEQTLGAYKTPLTALRAGIIIGPGGSSFQIIQKLTNRLPIMACPKWTKSLSQPIDVQDLLRIIEFSLGNEDAYNQAIEIGGPEVITYMEMLRKTAEAMGKKRLIFSIPFFTLGFSKLWVGLFSDSSTTFVSPLIESLRHDMTVDGKTSIPYPEPETKIESSIERALKEKAPKGPKKKATLKEKNTVRSVQRLPNPSQQTAIWVASAYPQWLSRVFRYLLRATESGDLLVFKILGVNLLKLQFVPDRSDEKRQLFYIVGGVLAKRTDYGWLEFRSVLNGQFIMAAIHEFVPRLPWYVYKNTQAKVHLFIMNRFGKYLGTLPS
jgi:uncharacterized protein YbjT (DUF2867 family)